MFNFTMYTLINLTQSLNNSQWTYLLWASCVTSDDQNTLNLSGQGLKKLTKGHCSEDAHKIISLSLESNELQRLDNIDGFPNLMEVSVYSDIGFYDVPVPACFFSKERK